MKHIQYLVAFLIFFPQGAARAEAFDTNPLRAVGSANWTVTGETVEADSGEGFLVTRKKYGDFRLKVEFRADPGSNSGLFFRCEDGEPINDQNCYEANIFDQAEDQTKRTGALVNIAPPAVSLATEGQWNTYEIEARGDVLTVTLNGHKTVAIQDSTHGYGPIALQYRAGKIRFRNFTIQSLDADVTGVWEMTGFDLDDGRGNVTQWCSGSYGTLLYLNGYMSVGINCTSAPGRTVFYSGPYHTEGNTVVHRVRNFSDSKLNQVFRRTVEKPDQNTLDLVGPFGATGKAVVSWKRREE